MALHRCSVLALVAFALLACSQNDLTTPDDAPDDLAPLFAKKVKIKEPVIREFWVVPGASESAPDIIHVVVSDNVYRVNPSVVYDYFHNGIVDDDRPYDQHYEWYMTGPPSKVVTDLENGWVHVDIEWDGRVHNDNETLYWPDHVSIEIPGEGDPYGIVLSFYDEQGNTLDRARPRGVVVNGIETKEAEVDLSVYDDDDLMMGPAHNSSKVRSYATFKGEKATGFVSLSKLTMTGLVCEAEKVVTGKGKDRVVGSQYRLTAQVTVAIKGAENHLTWEGHFHSIDTGLLSSRMRGGGDVTDATASAVMPADWNGEGDVDFVVDFLFSSELTWDYVYNPWDNVPPTTAGFGETAPFWATIFPPDPSDPYLANSRSGLEDGMAVPVAHSQKFGSPCQ